MMNVTLQTKLVGFIGKPLAQSFSQKMHNAAFMEKGLDYFFLPSEIEADAVGPVLNGLRYMNYVGLSVTKPYKIAVLPFLDAMDDSASIVGSVNAIVIRESKLIGYNTDGEGFLKSLNEEAGVEFKGNTFFLSGAGGAARAIAIALAFRGAKKIYIVGRGNENSSRLARDINEKIAECAVHIHSGDVQKKQKAVSDSQVLINGSGLGMAPRLNETPVPMEWIRPEMVVSDLTYNPAKTRFLQEAEKVGCLTVNGLGMLVNQGVKAFELWTGRSAPEELMRSIVSEIVLGK